MLSKNNKEMVVNNIFYLLAFVVSFVIVYLLIPPFGKLAFRLDFVDKPQKNTERKIHRAPIPLTASYVIFIGFFVTYLLVTREFTLQTAAIFVGGVLLLIIGTVDDCGSGERKRLSCAPQIYRAGICSGAGLRFWYCFYRLLTIHCPAIMSYFQSCFSSCLRFCGYSA